MSPPKKTKKILKKAVEAGQEIYDSGMADPFVKFDPNEYLAKYMYGTVAKKEETDRLVLSEHKMWLYESCFRRMMDVYDAVVKEKADASADYYNRMIRRLRGKIIGRI